MTTLTAREAATLIGFSMQSLRQAVWKGQIVPYEKKEGRNLFKIEEVERFKKNRNPLGRPKKK